MISKAYEVGVYWDIPMYTPMFRHPHVLNHSKSQYPHQLFNIFVKTSTPSSLSLSSSSSSSSSPSSLRSTAALWSSKNSTRTYCWWMCWGCWTVTFLTNTDIYILYIYICTHMYIYDKTCIYILAFFKVS